MRILISTSYYLPNVSGITAYIKILSEELVLRKNQVTVLTSRHNLKSKKKELNSGVKIVRLWSPIKLGKGVIMPFYPFSSFGYVKNNEIINCHLPSIESFWIAFWNIFFKKKLIVTYHCDFDSGNKFLNKIISLIQSLPLLLSEKIIVNSKDYIDGYKLLKKYRDKIVEIYPPVKINKIVVKKERENDKKIIGFLGRISKEKNLELFFEIIPLLKKEKNKFVIMMAGPEKVIGEEDYRNKIENYLKLYKNEVVRVGEIKEVNSFLEKCDCLVITSNNRLESFGIVQVEAIKNGTPCVVGNLPGIREVIKTTKMGEIFEINDKNDFADKILTVLNNGKEFYKNRAKNLDEFDYQKSLKKYEKTFFG